MRNRTLRTLLDDKDYTVRLTPDGIRIQSKATGRVKPLLTTAEHYSDWLTCFTAVGFTSEKNALARRLYIG